ncbi:enoyl-CoA hydratase/isomerase family protein [bacterium]|nr:enoyl-CoA hydratase/isomerase family protein [bacterium]
MNTAVQVRREGPIVTAVLNRPEKLNALNKEIFDDLKTLIDVLETDKTARVLIITGSGDKAFCVGADLKERQGMNEKAILQRFDFVHTLYQRIEQLPFPVIAAIGGTALGGGLELALTADIRVAADNAVLGLPEVDLAIIPGNGGTQRLARAVGMSRAMEMIFQARRLSAQESMHLGLVQALVAPGYAVSHARQWALKMLEAGPLALRQAKLAVRQGIEMPLAKALAHEVACYRPLIPSKDRIEGMKAFLEKRKPQYTGE